MQENVYLNFFLKLICLTIDGKNKNKFFFLKELFYKENEELEPVLNRFWGLVLVLVLSTWPKDQNW